MATAVLNSAFVNGLRGELEGQWRQTHLEAPAYVTEGFKDVENVDGRYLDFHAYREPGNWKAWEYGDPRPSTSLEGVTKRYYVRRFGNEISWQRDDEADQRSKVRAAERAREIGGSAARIDEDAFIALLTATADGDALKAIPTCIDGNAIYSTSHEEHASGNIVSGTSTTTTADIKAAFFAGLRRWTEMKFPKSQNRYFVDSHMQRAKFRFYVSPALREVFEEITKLNDRLVFSATTDESYAASLGNIVRTLYGSRIELIVSPYLTGTNWYAQIITGEENHRPFLRLKRGDDKPEIVEWNPWNSDRGRDYDEEGISFKLRCGWAPANYNTLLKITS